MAKRKRENPTIDSSDKGAHTDRPSSRATEVDEQDAALKTVRFDIAFESKTITGSRRDDGQKPQLIFTHGAGGTIDSPAIAEFLKAFPSYACFNGSMNLKSRVKYFHAVVEHFNTYEVWGGRSMGARAAVTAALEMERKPKALVLVSYPLTGGKEGKERQQAQREQILLDLPGSIDVLFAIGSEDHQCDLSLLREIMDGMKARTWLLELKGADHGTSLKHKAAVAPMRAEIGNVAAEWLGNRDQSKRYRAVAWDQDEGCITSKGWEETTKANPKSNEKRKKSNST